MIGKIVFFAFCALAIVLANDSCIKFASVCVPAHALKQGCRCMLIRPGQASGARAATIAFLLEQKRNVGDVIKIAILPQNGTDQLNRLFPPGESAPVGVDNNVFASINTQVHVQVMTLPRNLTSNVIEQQSNWLSPEARRNLLNCGKSECEVVGDVTDRSTQLGDRKQWNFQANRAIRYDFSETETMIAFTTATSEFVLNDVVVSWTEEECKRRWLVFKRCWDEVRTRKDPRAFDGETRINWINHVNRAMVGKFRDLNANLLV